MNRKKYFWISWAGVLLLSLTAFLLLQTGFINYGITLFCVLPACIGLLTGIVPQTGKAIFGMLAALTAFIGFLWIGGFEGIVCILMALPIIAICILLGYIIAAIFRYFTRKDDTLKFSFLPFIIFLSAAGFESFWEGRQSYDMVTTTVVLPFQASEVYDNIKEVDTVTASPSLFHKLGLPYPRKCIMTAESEGGLRICEFDEGKIVETILKLRKNELLEMEVSVYDLPGQNWFSFKKDIYEIKGVDKSTTISRTTTYTSGLKPRMYWTWIEKMTIGAEQELVFKNLENELAVIPH
jgi:hypothetical protein